MPKLQFPPVAAFLTEVEKAKNEIGVYTVAKEEMKQILESIDTPYIQTKKKKKGIELCISFFYKGRRVYAWTTLVISENAFRLHDQAWVLIVDDRFPKEVSFFSFPIRRTENFIENFFGWLYAFVDIVQHWPVCPTCGKDLRLGLAGGEMHSVKFRCPNKHRLPKDWKLTGVKPENLAFIQSKFDRNRNFTRWEQTTRDIYRKPQRVITAERKKALRTATVSKSKVTIDTTAFNDLEHEGKE
jgi:hypothetical protein